MSGFRSAIITRATQLWEESVIDKRFERFQTIVSLRYSPLNIAFLICIQSIGSDLYARWDHRNARELNRYEVLGLEFYNDLLSYRAPWIWKDALSSSQVRYEAGSGSLNQRDLFFVQRISAMTDPEEPWRLHYQRYQTEDATQIVDQNQIELSYGVPTNDWRFGLLTDGTTDKAYADLGLSTVWGSPKASYARLDLWWVDGFFADKKPNRSDARNGDPHTLSFDSRYQSEQLTIQGSFEKEYPIEWIQTSLDTVYRSERDIAGLLVERRIGHQNYYVDWQREWLKETLGSRTFSDIPGYTVDQNTLEMGFKQQLGQSTSQLALWSLNQNIDYRGVDPDPQQGFPRRLPGLKNLLRREYAAFTTWHQPWPKGSAHAQQWGLFINRVILRESGEETSTELKLQWSFDWAFSKQGRLLFGTTWDLDQLAQDFPFGEKPFRPWGGGYVQILAGM